MRAITDFFAENVFNDDVMKNMLPDEIYSLLKKTVEENLPLDERVAKVVAAAMKDWAIGKGATHYTHWFQPMTGITAEKHDSFISKNHDGKPILEFNAKELIKGESDASSFPSGGIRATFEARGYTAWDPTSYAFIKDNVLCIPTAFCSYSGEALDKKTPLLRSMEVINKQTKRLLKLFGKDVKKVNVTVGAEQEYFLIDKSLALKRKDLIFTGRTLFGARPPKGQELSDHYFGTIRPRVASFMKELDEELWKLGVMAKTEHNEAAPSQHELAPLFETVNIATDNNQLTMEIMKKVAEKNNLLCLLHEKPFEYVNGSGKHNNWSLSTDSGENLFDQGDNPSDNRLFLLMLCAFIKAVDEYQDLLRLCIASAGNDHRLGGNEAPPAIVSIYLGEELTDILTAIETGKSYEKHVQVLMKLNAKALPRFMKDTIDRNRTSPIAFTGNKFEFRMPGSSASISGANIVLNTIVANSFAEFSQALETSDNVNKTVDSLLVDTIVKHKRIIFNGNNYSKEWLVEAKKRGLANLKSTAEALPYYCSPKNVALFERFRVFTQKELRSRTDILLENYIKCLRIEALTTIDIARQEIFPFVNRYVAEILEHIKLKKDVGTGLDTSVEENLSRELANLNYSMFDDILKLENLLEKSKTFRKLEKIAAFYRDEVFECMNSLRQKADRMEMLSSTEDWPLPTYAQLLFGV